MSCYTSRSCGNGFSAGLSCAQSSCRSSCHSACYMPCCWCCCWCCGGGNGSNMFTLGGTIYGSDGLPVGAGTPVAFTVNGAATTVATNAQGFYSMQVPANAGVTITPQVGLGVTVTPPNYQISPVTQSNTGLDFHLSPITPVVFSLGGSLIGSNGLQLSGFPVDYTVNGASYTAITDSDGIYSIIVPSGANVTITPRANLGITFIPPSRTLSNVNADNHNLNFSFNMVNN